MPEGALVWEYKALFKIAMKQYLGHLMILDEGEGEGVVQNALFKIAAKQCIRLLMMLNFDTLF